MPLLSVITAVHTGRQEYLKEAAVTVLEQKLPENWELEWLVQEEISISAVQVFSPVLCVKVGETC